MKHRIIISFLILFTLVSTIGCASASDTTSKKHPSPNYMVPKVDEYSYVNYSNDLKTASFNGKDYMLLTGEEFDSEYPNSRLFSIGSAYSGAGRAKAHDGSWLGSKIYGNREKFDEIVIEKMTDNTHGMGRELAYNEDGVLHLICRKEKRDGDWYICYPSIMTREYFERGNIYEIRYKMPVRGSCVVYHMALNLVNDTGFNEQNWTFKQLFMAELLSGMKNKVSYGSSMWFGKKVESKQWSVMENAIADRERSRDAHVDYANPYNVYDDNSKLYDMTDDQFYEWHTVTAVYDEERFAVYHDGRKTYDWIWDDTPEIGKPQDMFGMKGPVQLVFSTGLAGDWAEFFNGKELCGNFDDYTDEYDVQLDYIRIYKESKQ